MALFCPKKNSITLAQFHIIDNCPVCQSNEFEHFMNVPDWLVSKKSFELSRCSKCNFVFTSNAPRPEEIGPFYESEEYVEHSDTNTGVIYGIYHYARQLMLGYKFKRIKDLTSGKKLLDVGSGSGYFVNHMKNKGYDVTGVEISDKAVKLCSEKFGINAHSPKDFLANKLDKDYDLITLWHVFEHVYTVDEYFKLFSESLAEGGALILALPNLTSKDAAMFKEFWAAYDTPRHLWHFSPNTLELLANNKGFTLERKYKLPLDPFFNSMVSASYMKKFTFLPFTILKGLWSFTLSLFNIDKSSSLIYVLRKTT